MSLLKSFSESVVNRSNNRGKLNYEKLYELLEKEAPKNLNLLSSKSSKKSLPKVDYSICRKCRQIDNGRTKRTTRYDNRSTRRV